MAMAKGSRARLLGGIKETTYNSDPTTKNAISLPINRSVIRATQNMNVAATIRGRRDPSQPFLGNINVAGSVDVPVDIRCIGYWLQMLLGDPITVAAPGSKYKHTFKVAAALDSWVLEQQYLDVGKYQKFNGCKVKSFKMTVGGDGELLATIEVVGGSESVSSTSVDAHPILPTLTRFQQFSATLKEGGSSIATAQTVEFTIENNLDETVYVIGGSGFRNALPEGIMKISGSIKVMFEDWTMYQRAIDGTERSIEVTFTNGTNTLKFTFDELMYARNAPAVEGPGGIWLTLPFEAYYENGGSASGVAVELINDTSTYASIATSTTSTTSTTTSTSSTSSTTSSTTNV